MPLGQLSRGQNCGGSTVHDITMVPATHIRLFLTSLQSPVWSLYIGPTSSLSISFHHFLTLHCDGQGLWVSGFICSVVSVCVVPFTHSGTRQESSWLWFALPGLSSCGYLRLAPCPVVVVLVWWWPQAHSLPGPCQWPHVKVDSFLPRVLSSRLVLLVSSLLLVLGAKDICTTLSWWLFQASLCQSSFVPDWC